MKKLIALLALFGAVTLGAPGIALAQDKGAPAATAAEAKPAAAAPAAAAAAPAAAEKPAEAKPPAPTPNKGDVAWMLICTALVIMMSIPALAPAAVAASADLYASGPSQYQTMCAIGT